MTKRSNSARALAPLVWIALGIGALFSLSFSLGLFRGAELSLEDRLFAGKPIDHRIVILAADDSSISKIGAWPWPRAVWGTLISKLAVEQPAVIGLDVLLSEASLRGNADDAALAQTLKETPAHVVMPKENGSNLVPLPLFTSQKSVTTGTVNFITDPDGVVRRAPLLGSFASEVAQKARANTTDPTAGNSRIVFAGPPGSVRTISIGEYLAGTSRVSLRDAVVLVGATAPDLHDDQVVPTSAGTSMSGVEIQAQTVNMLVNGYTLATIPLPFEFAWIILLALLPALFFTLFPRSVKPIAASIATGIFSTLLIIILFGQGTVVDIIHTNLAWIFSTAALFAYRYFVTEKERREMRHAFSKYVSKDILNEILEDPKKVQLGGAEKDATVFFSDVRGFTTLSEGLTASELVAFLNKYLTVMTDIAIEHRGVIDKYIGDAIMAFWGAPISTTTHAVSAMLASLEMVEALHVFNEVSKRDGQPPIDIGIGLNSGPVVAGNMGSTKRFDYTVMGDTVNLASRLEGQTKTYGVHVIASENSIAKVTKEDRAKHDLIFRELDKIKVKGKKLPVTIFEVVEYAHRETVREILPDFAAALALYYQGAFGDAKKVFEKILTTIPSDGPSKLLLERCAHFLEHPPEAWTGVYEFKTK